MNGHWLTVLTSFASVATALIGFSSLITAFRTTGAPLDLRDIIGIRILLIFSLGALVFALLPLVIVAEGGSWHLSGILLGLFLLFWPARSPSWNRRRGYRPRRPVVYRTLLTVMALSGAALIGAGSIGWMTAPFYAAGVGFCLLISLVAFLSQVFALLPADRR